MQPDGCWHWKAGRFPAGYGQWTLRKDYTKLAHRISYGALVGDLVDGLTIDHVCHNENLVACRASGRPCLHRLCVNPAHLEQKSLGDNTLQGGAASALHARKTHCKNGHEFSESNTRVAKTKWGTTRKCLACEYINHQRWYWSTRDQVTAS